MNETESDFREIHEDYRPRILRYLTRLVGEGEAEDLTQEVFVKIDRGLKGFRGESQLSTWIYRIATCAARDRLRGPSSRERQPQGMAERSVEEAAEGIWTGEAEAPAEQRVIRQEMNGCIREIVDTLPDHYRSVIVLSEMEGLKDGEIAEILGVGLQTVKMRLHRGRAMLKRELSMACVFYRDERNELACDRKGDHPKLIGIGERPEGGIRDSGATVPPGNDNGCLGQEG